MTATRAFCCADLLRFNRVNADVLTETYDSRFYLQYLSTWPGYCVATENAAGETMGYILGKSEGKENLWHGHVTAVTVAPFARRIGLAGALMRRLEDCSEHTDNAFFVDLFVRVSNALAIYMYERMGYVVYRRVLGYYSYEEDAFDMRKALPRDRDKASMVPLGRDIEPHELEW